MSKTFRKINAALPNTLAKVPTGILGFDEITQGGLPKGRPSLICGEAGCGKTLFSMEFIIRGAAEFNEPGVFIAFEEKADELATNVASLGFDVNKLVAEKKIKIDYIHIERNEIAETGEYDLEGLFIRIGHAIDSIKAKRIVLDTIENLFSGLKNQAILRAEIRRLFQWLKEKKVTAVITGEKGAGMLTREGLEEYVSDCVILLDNRVTNQITTRRLRIIKYRGSVHGTNEYPFLIDEDGISVLPVTSLKLEAKVSTERVSSGIPSLDVMLEGKGFFKGSSILISGTAGTGKTSIAASFVNEGCKNNKRCIYFAFEESPDQILRNMRSVNIDLEKYVKKGLLKFHAARPTMYGLEMHLVVLYKQIKQFNPEIVIVDPITNFISIGSATEVQSILTRLTDFLQTQQITALFTALSFNTLVKDQTDETISSLVDTWIQLRDIELNAERNRGLYIMKSRGMRHSNQIREFIISNNGLSLEDVYLGEEGVLTGSAREAAILQKATQKILQMNMQNKKNKEIDRKSKELEFKISTLTNEFESIKEELNNDYVEEELKKETLENNRITLAGMREKPTDNVLKKDKQQKKQSNNGKR